MNSRVIVNLKDVVELDDAWMIELFMYIVLPQRMSEIMTHTHTQNLRYIHIIAII